MPRRGRTSSTPSWTSTPTVDGAFVASSGKNMGAFKGVGYPEEIGRLLPPRGVPGPHLDRPQPLPDEHPGLVGRRAPLRPARLGDRAQRRDLELRHQPALPRAVRLPVHARHRHRGGRLPLRPAAAPPRLPLELACTALAAPCGARSTAWPSPSAPLTQSLRAVYGPAHAQRAVRHRARLQRRHGRPQRPHQAAPPGGRPAGHHPHGGQRGERAARGARSAHRDLGARGPASP